MHVYASYESVRRSLTNLLRDFGGFHHLAEVDGDLGDSSPR